MEGKAHHVAGGLIAAACCLAILAPTVAVAEDFQPGFNSRSSDRGVELTFTLHGHEIDVSSRARSDASASSCQWRLVPLASNPAPPPDLGPAPNRESKSFMVFCGIDFVRNVWIGPQNLIDLGAVARQIAERIVREIGVPTISVGINPVEGLAGLDSWFWVGGYDGAPIRRTVTELGMTVDVRIAHRTVKWDFGDGSPPVVGDLGRAYPERSTVTHVYTHRSLDTPYVVTATFDLYPEYRVDGAGWLPLPAITRAGSAPYIVREAQAVID